MIKARYGETIEQMICGDANSDQDEELAELRRKLAQQAQELADATSQNEQVSAQLEEARAELEACKEQQDVPMIPVRSIDGRILFYKPAGTTIPTIGDGAGEDS